MATKRKKVNKRLRGLRQSENELLRYLPRLAGVTSYDVQAQCSRQLFSMWTGVVRQLAEQSRASTRESMEAGDDTNS
jgi:hypothetical protein